MIVFSHNLIPYFLFFFLLTRHSVGAVGDPSRNRPWQFVPNWKFMPQRGNHTPLGLVRLSCHISGIRILPVLFYLIGLSGPDPGLRSFSFPFNADVDKFDRLFIQHTSCHHNPN